MLRKCIHELVPELLLKLSDTLHIQYRYNEHVHEEVSKTNMFGQVTAYQTQPFWFGHFFIDHYCGGGGWRECGDVISIAYCPFLMYLQHMFLWRKKRKLFLNDPQIPSLSVSLNKLQFM